MNDSPIRPWFQTVLDFLFPAECVHCHNFAGDNRVLIFCRPCWDKIPILTGPVCPRCGKPLASEAALQYSPNFLCGDCRILVPDFDRVFSVARYDGILREAIRQFKFYQKTGLGKHFVQLLISYMPDNIEWTSYQTILPVPLHKKRKRERGYNQASILARHLARHYRLNFIQNNLIRIKHTEAQWPIKERGQRQANVKNAFHLRFPFQVQDQHLILIDDVFTTGATVNECAKTLKKAGAKSVLVLTVARAGLDSQ